MKYFKPYNGTRLVYRIDYKSFVNPLNYLEPSLENQLRSRYSKIPIYNPMIKRLNTPNIAGYSPVIKNY